MRQQIIYLRSRFPKLVAQITTEEPGVTKNCAYDAVERAAPSGSPLERGWVNISNYSWRIGVVAYVDRYTRRTDGLSFCE